MEMTIRQYQSFEMDNLITEMRLLTDFNDEQLYDEVVSVVEMTEDEQEMLAEKLGIL